MGLTHEQLLNQGLPKWPQHVVTGVPVSVAQANEIIRRTDTFVTHGYGGNDRDFERALRKKLGFPPSWDDYEGTSPSPWADSVWREKQHEATEAFNERWRPVSTEYVHNSWIACAFIGGPHGWCHPDGQIGFIDNVGKWPSVENVYDDWKKLAEAFPFIDVGATLKNGEEGFEGSDVSVVSFRVRNGTVTLVDPSEEDVHKGHPEATRGGLGDGRYELLYAQNHDPLRQAATGRRYASEGHIPDEWLVEWANKFGPKVETTR